MKAKTWPWPAWEYFPCRAWNSSGDGSRGGGSSAGPEPWNLSTRLETVSLIAAAMVKLCVVGRGEERKREQEEGVLTWVWREMEHRVVGVFQMELAGCLTRNRIESS